MKINPYLNFDGTCGEAFRFYAQVLGGNLELMTFRDSPMAEKVGPEWQDRVLHAYLEVDGDALMGSDVPPGTPHAVQGMWVALHANDIASGERIFNAFAEGGTVTMPFEETFWAKRYGMVTDRFGTQWMVNVAS